MLAPPSDNLYIKGLPEEFDTDAVNLFFSACGTVTSAKSLGMGAAMVRFASLEEAKMVKENMDGQQPVGCPTALSINFATTKKPDAGSWGGAPAWGDSSWDAAQGGATGGPQEFLSAAMALLQGCGKGAAKGDDGWGASSWGQAGGKGAARPAPYGKGKAKGGPGIQGLINGLIAEGLPGGNDKGNNALYVTNLPPDATEGDLYTIFACFGPMPPRGTRVMPCTTPGSRTYGFVNFLDAQQSEFAMMAMNGVTMPDGCQLVVKKKTMKNNEKGGHHVGPPTGMTFPSAVAAKPVPAGIDPLMLSRLQTKLTGGKMSSYELSQWYIMEFLGHVTEEVEMKQTCDMLLGACAHIGLS